MNSQASQHTREARLDALLAEYLQAAETGSAPNRESFIAANTEFADDLREFFADRQTFERAAAAFPPAVGLATAEPCDAGDSSPAAEPTLLSGDPPAAASPLPRVRYFGDYELLEEIARGGMGVVYKTRQVNLKRIVALKMILVGQLANDEEVRRFQSEAQAAARLEHPHIVPIFEIGQHEGQHYFTMAYIDGASLAHRVARDVMAPRQSAEIMLKVARAIAFAHVEGVVHRDLKPANILIDRDGEPHITDFGLAKRVGGGDPEDTSAAQLTASGQVLGTPSYMPPEQAAGRTREIGPLSDVYSLGAVLYCLVTGRPPFQAASPLDTLLQVIQQEPVSPRQLNAAVPRDLETICLKCLEKDSRKRYASAKDLADELERFLKGEPIHARPVSQIERGWRWCRRNPLVAAASTLACAALVATAAISAAFAIEQSRAAERDRRKLAESYLDKGQEYSEKGDVGRGMLWFAKSLEEAPSSAIDLQRAIRANLGAWRPRPARLRTSFDIEQQDVMTVGFSGDGKIAMAVGDQSRTVFLWDTATGKRLGQPVIPLSNEPRAVALSPDGRTIVTGSNEHGVHAVMREALTGKPIRSLQLHPPRVTESGTPLTVQGDLSHAVRVAYSADGRVLASSDFMTAQLWDAANGKPRGERLRGHSDWIEALAISFDGKLVATGSRDGTARLWDAATSKPIGEPLPHGDTWVSSAAFSPDGKILLTGTHAGLARFWNVATGTQISEPISHAGWLWTVAWSPQGDRILTGVGGGSNTAILWDVATRKMIGVPLAHDHYVNAVAISSDGRMALTGSRDHTARLWDLPSNHPQERILQHTDHPRDVAFSPDGKLIAVGVTGADAKLWEGRVWIWNAATGRPDGEPLQHEASVDRVVFSPDGKLLAAGVDVQFKHAGPTGGERQTDVCVWDMATRKMVCKPLVHALEMPRITFDSEGRLVTTDTRGMRRVWNVSTGKPIGEPTKDEQPGVPIARSPNGRYEMYGNGEDNLGILKDLVTPEAGGVVQPPHGVGDSAFSPDSRLVVTASTTSWLWDVATRKAIGPSLGPAIAVAFSPDGKTIAAADWSGPVRLFTIPPVAEGPIERITLWAQVLSGSELSLPARRTLRADEWLKRQQKLDALGGPPLD